MRVIWNRLGTTQTCQAIGLCRWKVNQIVEIEDTNILRTLLQKSIYASCKFFIVWPVDRVVAICAYERQVV